MVDRLDDALKAAYGRAVKAAADETFVREQLLLCRAGRHSDEHPRLRVVLRPGVCWACKRRTAAR